MDLTKRIEIAKRQDAQAAILAQKRDCFRRAEEKYRSFFTGIDKSDTKPFGELPERKSESFDMIIKIFLTNPEEYEKKKNEINTKYPQFTSKEPRTTCK